MVSVTPAGAVLKKPGGTQVTIPLSRLSDADRAWVLEWAEAHMSDAFDVRGTMKKVANGPAMKNMTRSDRGSYNVRVKSTAWTENWCYELRLVNRSPIDLADVTAKYVVAVKQSSRGIESELKYRHVRGNLKIERCPRITPLNVATDTYVLNFSKVIGTANDGEELTARKQAEIESLSGIWIRFYGKTGTQIGEWKSGGGLKDITGPE